MRTAILPTTSRYSPGTGVGVVIGQIACGDIPTHTLDRQTPVKTLISATLFAKGNKLNNPNTKSGMPVATTYNIVANDCWNEQI